MPAGHKDLCLCIDSEFLGGGRATSDVTNPANGETIAQQPHASGADLDSALAAAERAFKNWRNSSPLERSRILRKVGELTRARAPAIGRNTKLEMGKSVAEAAAEGRKLW